MVHGNCVLVCSECDMYLKVVTLVADKFLGAEVENGKAGC